MTNLNIEWFKKKWYLVVLAFGFLTFTITAAIVWINSSRELTESQQIVVAYMKAYERDDDSNMLALLTPEKQREYKEFLSGTSDYPEKNIKNYNLSEWKINDETFVYRIQYLMNDRFETRWTMTQKTKDGWGVADLLYKPTSLQPLIQGKHEKIVREMKE